MYYIFNSTADIEFKEFTKYWADLYTNNSKINKDKNLYDDIIHKREFSEEDISALYTWINGVPLRGKKLKTVKLIMQNISLINRLKNSEESDIISYLDLIKDGIWKIFLLHIIRPDIYPILDQHTYRAYQYIKTNMLWEMPRKKKMMLDFYFNEYIPFIQKNIFDSGNTGQMRLQIREIDKALFAFGKFLKSPFVNMLGTSVDTKFVNCLFSSVYSQNVNGTYDFSPQLKKYLSNNVHKVQKANNLFNARDFYMQEANYEKRWEMGHYLMHKFDIEFEQSERSELLFSLCMAIMQEFSLSELKVGELLEDVLSKQLVK